MRPSKGSMHDEVLRLLRAALNNGSRGAISRSVPQDLHEKLLAILEDERPWENTVKELAATRGLYLLVDKEAFGLKPSAAWPGLLSVEMKLDYERLIEYRDNALAGLVRDLFELHDENGVLRGRLSELVDVRDPSEFAPRLAALASDSDEKPREVFEIIIENIGVAKVLATGVDGYLYLKLPRSPG